MTHGTVAAYSYRGCRCAECRRMWAAYQKAYSRVRRILGRCTRCTGPAAGWRCLVCKEKLNRYQRAQRAARKLKRAA